VRESVVVFCDTAEVPSGIPELLRSRGVPTRVCVLRKTRRLEHIEEGPERTSWLRQPTARLSPVRAPRADYLFVHGGDLILAAVERKTRAGFWSDYCAREASGERHLSSQLSALSRLPNPFLVVEGRLPRQLREREQDVRALVMRIVEHGLPVVAVPGKRDTARILEGHWRTLTSQFEASRLARQG
jgi:ERCC4-type nuclease